VIEAELAFAHDHMFTSIASFNTRLRKPIIVLSTCLSVDLQQRSSVPGYVLLQRDQEPRYQRARSHQVDWRREISSCSDSQAQRWPAVEWSIILAMEQSVWTYMGMHTGKPC
jgi:hypothetical protein